MNDLPSKNFWEKPLNDLDQQEWELLCDGCARCCLVKLQDEDTDEIVMTSVVCRFLDQDSCQCTVYPQRAIKKPDCFVIERENATHYSWLPDTCAYRLRWEGQPLPAWHLLLTGSRDRMNEAEISVTGQCTSEEYVHPDELENFVSEDLMPEV